MSLDKHVRSCLFFVFGQCVYVLYFIHWIVCTSIDRPVWNSIYRLIIEIFVISFSLLISSLSMSACCRYLSLKQNRLLTKIHLLISWNYYIRRILYYIEIHFFNSMIIWCFYHFCIIIEVEVKFTLGWNKSLLTFKIHW